MTADAAMPGTAWVSVAAAVVFLLVSCVLAADRARTRRRLHALERSEALLETDLADARREIAALRDCLRDGAGEPAVREAAPGPGDAAARG